MKLWILLATLVVGILPPPAAAAGAPARLWALQPGARLVAFDLSDFSRRDSLEIPPVGFDRPELLMLGGGEALLPIDDQRIWVWDGAASRTFSATAGLPYPRTPPGVEAVASRQWFLTADRGLLVAENDFATTPGVNPGAMPVVATRFHVERLDLAGRPSGRLLEHSFEPCSCATGACDETCPQGDLWAPGGVAADYFFVTHWVPGQLNSEFQSSFLCRRGPGGWRSTPLPHAVERFLDAADSGSTWIEVQGDGGCCGWANEGSDRTTWVRRAGSQVLFDEWARFHNQDYDVSFSTRNALIAPGGRRVAYTVVASEKAGAELRLSSDGHPNSLELAAIEKTLAGLPMVEVQEPALGADPTLRLPGAELVGWSSPAEVVIVENGRVVAVDVTTRRRRESQVRVRSAADVYLVRP
jgi:hypothetical protein